MLICIYNNYLRNCVTKCQKTGKQLNAFLLGKAIFTPLYIQLFDRDGEEWFTYRKLLNDVLLKRDYYAQAEENAAFVDDIFEKWLHCCNNGRVMDLENELYKLSMLCK